MTYRSELEDFTVAAIVRAIKTFAQTFVALAGTGMVGFTDLDWVQMLSVAGVSAVLSVMTSIATGLPEVPREMDEGDDE